MPARPGHADTHGSPAPGADPARETLRLQTQPQMAQLAGAMVELPVHQLGRQAAATTLDGGLLEQPAGEHGLPALLPGQTQQLAHLRFGKKPPHQAIGGQGPGGNLQIHADGRGGEGQQQALATVAEADPGRIIAQPGRLPGRAEQGHGLGWAVPEAGQPGPQMGPAAAVVLPPRLR